MKKLEIETLQAIASYINQVAPGFEFLLLVGSDADGSGHLHTLTNLAPGIGPRMAASYILAASSRKPDISGEFDETKH